MVGVIALSLILSVAASGFILLSGSSQIESAQDEKRRALYYAAEAGAYMATYYVTRTWGPTDIISFGNVQSTHDVTQHAWKFYAADPDTIYLYADLHGIPGPTCMVRVMASTLKPKADTVRIYWTIETASTATMPFQSKLAMKSWQDTVLPGR